jgi:hypothetical protein
LHIEILKANIQNESDVTSVYLPNSLGAILMLGYADDTTIAATTDGFIAEVFKIFEKAS